MELKNLLSTLKHHVESKKINNVRMNDNKKLKILIRQFNKIKK
jgi:hypothetical protein